MVITEICISFLVDGLILLYFFIIFQALCSLLRRDASINFKAKGNSLVSVLACNLLMAAYEEDENWPEIFVKVVEHGVLLQG